MPEHGEITFERRRYGRTTYTWAYLWVDGEQHQPGDPSPSVTFAKADLDQAIGDKLARLQPADDGRYSRPIKIF